MESDPFQSDSDSDSVFLDISDIDLYLDELSDNQNLCEFLNITIQIKNVDFINNSIPFTVSKYYPSQLTELESVKCVFITFTGHIKFYHNKGVIVRIPPMYMPQCSTIIYHKCHRLSLNFTNEVLFSKAEIYITNNDIILAKPDDYFTDDDHVAPDNHSPLVIESGDIVFEHCHIVFSGNHGTVSGGIVMQSETRMIFRDDVTIEFNNNIGQLGGALFLNFSSVMVFNATESTIALIFKNNSAQRGGAIFVEDNYSDVKSIFDFQCSSELVTLTFFHNLAQFGGNQIYGGWVDWFRGEDGMVEYNPSGLKKILKFERSGDSEVASCPFRICLCMDNRPDCNITNTTMEIYGYAVSLDLAAVGQRFTSVPGYVQANLTSQGSDIKQDELWRHWLPISESLQATCKKIVYYKLYSNEETILFEPFLDGCNSSSRNYSAASDSENDQVLLLFQHLTVHLKYHNCPMGFILQKSDSSCICHSMLSSLGLSCDLQAIKIHRNKQQWVGVAHEHTTTFDRNPGVIVHPYCPFDYCRRDNESVLIRLEDETELCAFNRSGLLCGACGANFSRVLGSSKCKVCSTNLFTLLALIFGWLLSGLILVILLMLLDITVSIGTINGLTFYANILQAQRDTFITPNFSGSFSYVFIAWLNLEQGIETCFYSGLDDYIVAWLQFLFPLYIWLIAVVLIVSSHYSTCVSKLLGRNAVQVFATLFLITYANLLQLIIDVISFTTITYPDGYKKTVWLIDGNIEFFNGRHIPLVLVTVVFILFSLPYILILLTIQFLYKISHYRIMFWVQRLKPFFDAYTGPYRDNHHYWTGLLLVVRIFLLTSFSLNPSDNPTINLFIIIFFTVSLLIWLYFTGFVYQCFLNNCLEAFFLFNLCLTSAAALFALSNGSHSPAVIYTSTGTSFMVFVGIILYHAQRRLFQSRIGAKLKIFVEVVFKGSVNNDYSLLPDNPNISNEPSSEVSCTVVDLTKLALDKDNEDS